MGFGFECVLVCELILVGGGFGVEFGVGGLGFGLVVVDCCFELVCG